MKFFFPLRFFILSSFILILAGCQSGQTPRGGGDKGLILTEPLPPESQLLEEDHKAVKVALLLPMSGKEAKVGRSLFNAAQLSLFEHAPDHIQLIVEDTKGSPELAVEGARKALAQGARVIVGPLFSNETIAVGQVARTQNVPVLSFSNNSQAAGKNVYILGFTPDQQIYRILSVAHSNGIQKIGLIVPKNTYGNLIKKDTEQTAQQLGIQLSFIDQYEPGSIQLDHVANKINTLGVEGLLIPEGGKQLKLMVSSLLYHQIDPNKVKFLGTGQWDSPNIIHDGALVGSWFVAAPIDQRQKFNDDYVKSYGAHPPRLASLAYDAISMISALTRTSEKESYFPTEMLTQSRGFEGVNGLFRFNPNGTVERGLAVYEITDSGTLKVISPAPDRF